jgi:hypothetical protein
MSDHTREELEDMPQKDKAKLVTVEYLLAKMVDVVEGVGVWETAKPAQALKALQMLGDYKKLFVQHKKVDINIAGLVRGMPDDTLGKIIDVEILEDGSSKNRGHARLTNGNKHSRRV